MLSRSTRVVRLWRVSSQVLPLLSLGVGSANKHKPWIEAEYQGIVMENDNTVLLNPPLFALDKDAPLRYAGKWGWGRAGWVGQREVGGRAGAREEGVGPGRESSEDLGKVEEGGSRREPGDGEKQWHSEGSQRRMCAGRG